MNERFPAFAGDASDARIQAGSSELVHLTHDNRTVTEQRWRRTSSFVLGGTTLKKRLAFWLVALVGVLSLLVPMAANAGGSNAKLRPVCVRQHVGNVNIQIGYCP